MFGSILTVLLLIGIAAGVAYLYQRGKLGGSAPAKPVPKPAPKPAPASAFGDETLPTPASEVLAGRAVLANLLALYAEAFEKDQAKLAEFLNEQGIDEVKQAASEVDWPEMIATYDDSTLKLIEERGTNIQFTKQQGETMYRLVKNEIRARARAAGGSAPGNHGMGDDGAQS